MPNAIRTALSRILNCGKAAQSPRRPRVLVILGAGSTLHAGAPSTKDIDDLVCGIDDEPIRSVVARLREQRIEGNFNFETVLAALEDLDDFSVRKNHPTAWASIGGYLAAFADYLPDFTPAADKSFLSARTQVIGRIKNFVISRTAEASPDVLRVFFDQLKTVFDLTVVTLNYDDLIDRAGDWYDGFSVPANADDAGTFDFAGFPKQSAQHPAVLMHLHGSVRFGFPRFSPEPPREGEVVRYGRPVHGLQATLHPPGGIAQPTPIIAGDGKDRWMTRACVPFGYYYSAFINTIQACPRVLVAGYGAGDQHVNSWLREEYPRLHGARRRLVHINSALLKLPEIDECLNLRGDEGRFPSVDAPFQARENVGTA
jgi:SIR2-like domain